jgi:nucleotidyltransferase/DNA polymerase involved in DNA repair
MEGIENNSIMEQKTPKKRGRKTINIDYDRLEYLASLNMGTMDICRNLGISWDTFDRNKKRKAEFADALQRGKAKGLQRATSRLMDKIDDGEFQAIQFYLKNADSDNWSDKNEVQHNFNLTNVLQEANNRIIEGKSERIDMKEVQVPMKELTSSKKTNK